MTPNHIRTIRKEAGLSQTGLAAILRIKDIRTIRRWEKGEIPITGPASIILEIIEAGELPAWVHAKAGVNAQECSAKPDTPCRISEVSRWQKYTREENARMSCFVDTHFTPPCDNKADSDGDDGA